MSFYDDASLVFLAGGAAGKDGKAYNLKPDGSLGSELIADGGFDSASGWTKGTGWSISGGVASCDGTQTATTDLHETAKNGLVDGKTYRIEYTITSYSAGSIRVKAGNTGFGAYRSATGTYVENLVAGVTSFDAVQFNADADFIGSIDNVSCKEVNIADFTFTRGTNLTATRVGKDGYIEKGRENLLLQSNQFDTTWTDPNADVTSGYAGRDGSNDAWELSLTGTFGQTAQAVSASGVNTLSFYAKSGTSDFTRPYIAGPNKYAYFDLLNGQTGAQTGVASSIEDAGNGWWRCSFTVEGTITEVRLHVADSINTIGTTTSGTIYIQDAQLEQGLVATDYIETGASTATAGLLEDEPRFDYTGGGCPALLMEPTRTNHINHSEYGGGYETVDSNLTVTDNTEVSPEGYSNAVKIEDISTSSATQAVKFGALESGSVVGRTFTGSLYIKPVNSGDVGGNVYLSLQRRSGDFEGLTETIEIDSADWKRYEITYTFTGAGAGNQTGCDFKILKTGTPIDDIYVYGVQLEEGAFATSYIPTYGSSATRAKEGFTDSYDQINTLDLSSSGLNGEDVSWFFELKNNQSIARDSSATTIRVSSNTSNLGSLRIYRASSGVKQLTVYLQDTSSPSVPLVANGYEMTSENPKVLVKRTWSTGRIQVYVDGVSVIDEIDLDYNAWYKLELGGAGSTLELKQVLAFPTVLSNNDSEILTGATSYSSFADMATSTALNYTIYE